MALSTKVTSGSSNKQATPHVQPRPSRQVPFIRPDQHHHLAGAGRVPLRKLRGRRLLAIRSESLHVRRNGAVAPRPTCHQSATGVQTTTLMDGR
jgi:hypothetical protein